MDKSNGARYNKLKLVYKKAIQEILNKDLDSLEETPQTDSFYNASTSRLNSGSIKEKLDNLKNILSDLLKKKVKEYNLESKLDKLDTLIKDNVVSTRDIHDEGYIKEILESYLMEDKINLIGYVNNKIKENEVINREMENKIKIMEEEYVNLQKEYIDKEGRVQNMIKELKNGLI
ncbi:hypothetical protein P3W45_000750 [Vairimorpha bombi]|jgi:hypothetical protein